MYGIEPTSLFRFFMQLSLVVAGAASFWGFIFSYKAKRSEDNKWNELCRMVLLIFIPSLLFFKASWLVGTFYLFAPAVAHEGIVHGASFSEQFIYNGFRVNLIFVAILAVFNTFMIAKTRLKNNLMLLFGFNALFLSIILSLSAFSGRFDSTQIALSLHNWHSIITLGTVICVDVLFLLTIKKDNVKRVLYPFYPVMSSAIWLGLGLEFIGSFLILEGSFPNTPQFIFNQIVVVVLVLNGALLSVGVNDALIKMIKPDQVDKMSRSMDKVLRVSGSISIVSWITITFIDFFLIPLSLGVFVSIYVAMMLAAYIGEPIGKKFAARFVSRI